ncbi:MAG: hypothetical protein IT182_17205 [Acidobacteria bacterium]|nr:hypothetical protein [Acidobacteriota bacterium]
MGTIGKLKQNAQDNGWSAAFANGFTEGQASRQRNDALTAYLRVGIDDYAKGFRTGYFARPTNAPVLERPVDRQVVGL